MALLEQDGGVGAALVQRAGADPKALAQALAHDVAKVAGGAAVNGAAPPASVLRHVRCDAQLPQLSHTLPGVIVLVRANGLALLSREIRQHLDRRIALRRPRGQGQPDVDGHNSTGQSFNPTRMHEGFADSFAWGVRALIRGEYNDVVFGWTFMPTIIAMWDIKGIAPYPLQNFIQGRLVLKLAQVGRVGGADIDDEEIRMWP